ncbi:unnamed protein product, partial [Discosporangium mesarthrocarpum]
GEELLEEFAEARRCARLLDPPPPEEVAVELEGLRRQAMLGDWYLCAVPMKVPARATVGVERAHWEAWVGNQGIPRAEAMGVYIEAVNSLQPRHHPNPDSNPQASVTDGNGGNFLELGEASMEEPERPLALGDPVEERDAGQAGREEEAEKITDKGEGVQEARVSVRMEEAAAGIEDALGEG